MKQLLKQERVEKVSPKEESRFYLTDIGRMVAMGALDIYPELNTIL